MLTYAIQSPWGNVRKPDIPPLLREIEIAPS
jgi:hypothetical protein